VRNSSGSPSWYEDKTGWLYSQIAMFAIVISAIVGIYSTIPNAKDLIRVEQEIQTHIDRPGHAGNRELIIRQQECMENMKKEIGELRSEVKEMTVLLTEIMRILNQAHSNIQKGNR
jgi:hypothetical protein